MSAPRRRLLRRLGERVLDLLEDLAHARVHERALFGLQVVIPAADALGFAWIEVVGHRWTESAAAVKARGLSWALAPAIPAGALSGKIVVSIKAHGRTPTDLDDLARWAIDRCPVIDTVRRAIALDIEVRMT